ncbi:hypothetical protein [Oculatella sp. FACHB-28]|uniref:hypothetical protein n=1 Tax=Oculatella sp. FACHB-28 TaxID=2692845 RepID=UPI001688958E|nr:hypothetical protein [Oculatella sp. FACHB-28]
MIFVPTKQQNPCRICSDVSGKCRETDSIHLCMNLSDSSDAVADFRLIGQTKDGLWGKWLPSDRQIWSDQQREEWRRDRQQRIEAKALQEAQRRAEAMPAADRDRYYRELLSQLTLHPADRQDLLRRGLSDEQIHVGGFRSVEQWQRLEREFPTSLPGVNLDGLSLNTQPGCLCPIRDINGLIVGFQIRLRGVAEDGRYRWLTSVTKKRPNGARPHLSNGELPLAVFRPGLVTSNAIALVEGVGAKPYIASLRLKQTVVGAGGGLLASSPQTFKAILERLAREQDSRDIVDYLDAGDIVNSHVMRRRREIWKLLQQWGFTVRVGWWGQFDKSQPDIDELSNLSQIQIITTAKLEAIIHEFINPKFDWLGGIKRQLQKARKRPANGFASIPGQRQPVDQTVVTYQAGERLQTWQQAIESGCQFILDQSSTGTGKSYDSGRAEPEMFGVRQIAYVSTQHRNPTVDTLDVSNRWIDLEARHGGISKETTPNGNSRLRRATKGESYVVPPNCVRNGVISALRNKNVTGADTASLICGTCPLREACSHSEGTGYGFLHQRRHALSSPKLRAHPDSQPNPEEYDYSEAVLLWEEPGESFSTSTEIRVCLQDVEKVSSALLVNSPDRFEEVRPLLKALPPYLDGSVKLPRFGINHPDLVELLPALQNIDISTLEQVQAPDLSLLNTTAEHGVDLADLPAAVRRRFTNQDSAKAEQIDQLVVKQWLTPMLRTSRDEIPGASLHLGHEGLTITLPDERHRMLAKSARAVVFLDATISREDLALKLGCSPDDIFVCQQDISSHSNLKIIQVTDLGRMGMQRGKEQQRRSTAITAHYQQLDPTAKAIDFKRFAQDSMGAWWRDSRGVNDFEQVSTLILVGTPCRNLSALQAEYAVLTGSYPNQDDSEFESFVNRTILADIRQAIGRLRAHRRPDEQLQVVICSDFDLSALDMHVEQVAAKEITLEAASKPEIAWQSILSCVQGWFTQTGELPTQVEVSSRTGLKQSYISKLAATFADGWQGLKRLVCALVKPPPKDETPLSEDEAWVAEQYLPVVATECKGTALATELNTLIEMFSWQRWTQVLAHTPYELRLDLVAALFRGNFEVQNPVG